MGFYVLLLEMLQDGEDSHLDYVEKAIPTVVYGFAAVFLLVPVVREAAGKGSGLC